MREIKFRAWEPDQKRMYDCSELPVAALNGSYHPIMQYTGLKDKNGKEIYEGDILRSAHGICSVDFGKYVTDNAENEDILGWMLLDKYECHAFDPQISMEVIGNIYESPKPPNPITL